MIIDGKRAADTATTTVLAYYHAFNRGDWDAMAALVDDEVAHDVNQGERQVGKARFREFLGRMAQTRREELRHIIVMATYDGSRVAAEFAVQGTYLAAEAGQPDAHGQAYKLAGGTFFELARGRITRVTTYYNLSDWRRQVESQ
jgi:steroid delta-isomerase-like uncharacterized protein